MNLLTLTFNRHEMPKTLNFAGFDYFWYLRIFRARRCNLNCKDKGLNNQTFLTRMSLDSHLKHLEISLIAID